MLDTRHLDTAIEIFKGKAVTKRAVRKGINIVVYCGIDVYTIQCNGKMLEEGEGDRDFAFARANARANAMRKTSGKAVDVTMY